MTPTTYVLIPGFWLGAAVWQPVAESLRERGHAVHALDLPGMGERADLASPATDLTAHVEDVVRLLEEHDLRDVVLVGHSYGALVVTGAADRAADRVARLVYIDAGPLPDGMAQADFEGPEARAANEELVRTQGDGWQLPPPPWAALAADVPEVDDAAMAALSAASQPQPWRTATEEVALTGAWERLPRTGVLCSFGVAQLQQMAPVVPAFAHMVAGDWTYVELPTWHWPMVSRPIDLADVLADASTDVPA
ncbi:alpha/beta hydrolase [Nocardioides sp. zg-536]|uniref:Alpha/beta hydrolase n=1 Tax=Nocardioides faecalis TaxID=2803858 RepID=A0A938Y9X7_9ACTN|nr:alpha/beta hydrolase [Nocardioides faecalis]MBM9460146.1 alpha/beta hydrolase [Nocardioides faecalis]QVI60059.1 alpha/beta hydrolase [Nocardioides faecalis]